MNMFNKAKNFVVDTANKVGIAIPNVQKTHDPDYVKAKELFKELAFDVHSVIGSVQQMSTQISLLAQSTSKFGKDLSKIFSVATQQVKGQGQAIEIFGSEMLKFADNLSTKQMNGSVVAPLASFQKEMERLKTLKKERHDACRIYDRSRAELEALKKSNKSNEEVNKKDNEIRNTDFMSTVNRLYGLKAQFIELPICNCVGILNNLVLSICTESRECKHISHQVYLLQKSTLFL